MMQRGRGVGNLTAKNTTSGPDTSQGSSEAITTVGGHCGLDDLERLPECGHLEHVKTGTQKQVGELDGLLLQLLFPIGTSDIGGCDHGDRFRLLKGGPDQGKRVLLRGENKCAVV